MRIIRIIRHYPHEKYGRSQILDLSSFLSLLLLSSFPSLSSCSSLRTSTTTTSSSRGGGTDLQGRRPGEAREGVQQEVAAVGEEGHAGAMLEMEAHRGEG